MEQLDAVFLLFVGDDSTDKKSVRSDRATILDLNFTDAERCHGGWQMEFLRGRYPERKHVLVNGNSLVMSAKLVRNPAIGCADARQCHFARRLDRFDGWTAVAKGERETIRCDGTHKIHGENIAMSAIVNADEENGTRANVEDQCLLDGLRSRRHTVVLKFFARGPAVHPAVPGSTRPARTAVSPVAHFEQTQLSAGRTPYFRPTETKCSDRPPKAAIDKFQFHIEGTGEGGPHAGIHSHTNCQRLECGNHVVARNVELVSGGDETHQYRLLRVVQRDWQPLPRAAECGPNCSRNVHDGS